MDKDQHLDEYLEICKRIFEDMQRDGSWPWGDSPISVDLLESKDISNDL